MVGDVMRPRWVLRGAVVALVAGSALAWAPAAATGQQDTVRVDTAAVDTTLTPAQRALRRLRSMPASPIQRETARADSLAADSLTADSLAADTAGADIVVRDSAAVRAPGDPAGPPVPVRRPAPPDTVDRVMVEDSVLAALRTLPGYVSTEYRGEEAEFQAGDSQLRLRGESRVARGQNALETDSILEYFGDRGVVCGYGNPVLSGETDPVESRQVCYDIDRDLGMAVGARTQFQQGATWYVQGSNNRVYLLTGGEDNELYAENPDFTSCELEHPHYTFRARSLKMVENQTMVARDVTLRFEDVPVFWLPWMVQSMKRGRRSGLLMPEFGVNDIVRNSTGYNRHLSNLGFYWAMNDYVSARGTFEWFSNNWTALETGLTYRWLRQFLDGTLTAKQYWRQREGEPSSRELTLNTNTSWQPDERTRLNVSGTYATSSAFVRNNSFDPRELNRQISMAASANRSFGWGRMTLGWQRQEQLSNGQVDKTEPRIGLSVSPVTLFASDGGGLDLTWNASANAQRRLRDIDESLPGASRDSEARTADANHSITFGRLRLTQSVDYSEVADGSRPQLIVGEDTTPALPAATTESMGWRSSVSYSQGLWTGTTLSPTVSMSGQRIRDPRTSGDFVDAPTRISAGASLTTAIYGFWPGFAGFSRIRHKIAPTLSWSYSPEPGEATTALQDTLFGVRNLREQNQLSLSFNQTFEAKVAEDDTAAVDTSAAPVGEPGEPRRLPQARKVTLLALNTSTSFIYDFVSAEEENRGFLTEDVSNSIRSDLLQGLQVGITHDLFEGGERDENGVFTERRFSPYLTRLNASFSIDDDFWLFRFLGLTGVDEPDEADPDEVGPGKERGEGVLSTDDPSVGAESDPNQIPGGVGSVVPNRGPRGTGVRRGVGGWNASLNYSLTRRRPESGFDSNENQMLTGNLSFEPTEHWSVRWSTGYSFTDSEFANHVLTLSRDLHRWQANFDFIKAQNGNFVMQFRVQLRDNTDLKLDYDQRSETSRATGAPRS